MELTLQSLTLSDHVYNHMPENVDRVEGGQADNQGNQAGKADPAPAHNTRCCWRSSSNPF